MKQRTDGHSMSSGEYSKWLVIPKPNANTALRLFCFPYAGGNIATYASWTSHLPESVELVFVQPPGRGSRLLEPSYGSMTELANDLFSVIKDGLEDKPYLFFGHSLGARIAFELLRKIDRCGLTLPLHFVASGSPAPDHKMKESPMYLSDDKEFIDRLRHLNGTPEEILQNEELMALLLPALRKDFELAETYKCSSAEQINCSVSVFRGLSDDWVDEQSAARWSLFFIDEAAVVEFVGGHMFIEHSQLEVIEQLCLMMNKYTAVARELVV